jgi:hypothetical protein
LIVPQSQNQTTSPSQPFTMNMTDDAYVSFMGPDPNSTDGVLFRDVGYMPINSLTLGGNPLHIPNGFNAYIEYEGLGVQHTTTGTIDYTGLTYKLYAYNGNAGTFTNDPNASAGYNVTAGGIHNPVLLATGSLDPSGQHDLHFGGFDPVTQQPSTIGGQLDVSVMVGSNQIGTLDIGVQHQIATDMHWNNAGSGFSLDHGTLTAAFYPTPVA